MAKVTNTLILLVISAACASGPAFSGQMVYRPINPSFGGDPFNSAHLLGIANAIDRYKDPNAVDPFSLLDKQDPQALLNEQLQQQVTQGVNGNAIDSVLAQNSGTYNLGSSRVSITPNADGQTRRIVLQNVDTGARTVYDVPLSNTAPSSVRGATPVPNTPVTGTGGLPDVPVAGTGLDTDFGGGVVPNVPAIGTLPNSDFGSGAVSNVPAVAPRY